jgi:nucleotide-binding universal stress UspA family protein
MLARPLLQAHTPPGTGCLTAEAAGDEGKEPGHRHGDARRRPRRSLLVLLDHGPACATRSRFAIQWARERGWHLIGLAATGLIDLPMAARRAAPLVLGEIRARDALRKLADARAYRFEMACRHAGIGSFETVVDEADTAASVLSHAGRADVVLLTQAGAAPSTAGEERGLLEHVLLASARPTLVIPREGNFAQVGRRVLVAWDDSREAARAVSDALPLLVQARRVELVSWRECGGPGDHAMHARLDAAYRWLARHGVASHVHVESPHGPLADAMRSRAAQMGADLVVMGAYGHTRWMERVLGGATCGMLDAMSLPVLMSH